MDKRVFAAACGDYEQAETAVGRILNAFGGAKELLGNKKTVLVKPNLLMPRHPDMATTTHPSVVEAVCRAFVQAGASVSVIDSTGGPHSSAILKMLYGKTGMKTAAERSGAALSFDTSYKTVSFPDGKREKQLNILTPIAEAELVVSVGKVKTHSLAMYTGAVKNCFGAIPGMGKPKMHAKHPDRAHFIQMIVDVCECVKPGFSILDGIVGMEGDGPSGGTPKKLGVILGAVNPHALDLAAAHLISFRLERVPSLQEAFTRGFIPDNASELDWMGDDPALIKTVFKAPSSAYGSKPAALNLLPKKLSQRLTSKKRPYPIITERCTGCGECVRICPQRALTLSGQKAVLQKEPCIKCYCCHEFCPVRAIDL